MGASVARWLSRAPLEIPSTRTIGACECLLAPENSHAWMRKVGVSAQEFQGHAAMTSEKLMFSPTKTMVCCAGCWKKGCRSGDSPKSLLKGGERIFMHRGLFS